MRIDDFSWALATGIVYVMPRRLPPLIASGANESWDRPITDAPISVRGWTMRFIGLVRRERSPVMMLKKGWAAPLFLVSLLAVIVQFGHWLFLANAMEVYGTEAVFMPLLVTAIAAFLVWYSRDAKSKGWLS